MQCRFGLLKAALSSSCSGLFVRVDGLVDVAAMRAQTLHRSTSGERQKRRNTRFSTETLCFRRFLFTATAQEWRPFILICSGDVLQLSPHKCLLPRSGGQTDSLFRNNYKKQLINPPSNQIKSIVL